MSTQANTPATTGAPQAYVFVPQPTTAPRVRTESSAIVELPVTVARAAWRGRWQLAPLAGGAGVFACELLQGPMLATPLLGAGVATGLAWRYGGPIAGRMWLSARERGYAGAWFGIAGTWTLVTPLLPAPPGVTAAALAAALGYPSTRWALSRRPKRTKLSREAL